VPTSTSIEIEIEKLIYGGDGLARLNGKSIFVPRVLPGERLFASVSEDRRSFSRVEPQQWITTSATRVSPPCPYFTACGGCHYQHASYEAQLDIKRDIFLETLRRTGKIELDVPVQLHASPEPWNYRNRTRLHMQHVRRFSLGYFISGTHRLLEVRECPISSPLLNRAITTLWALGEAGHVPAFVFEVEIFANDADEQCLVELYVGNAGSYDYSADLTAFQQCLLRDMPGCIGVHAFLQSATVHSAAPIVQHVSGEGANAIHYTVGDNTYRVSAGSFFQVNRSFVGRFVDLVTADANAGSRALDLYAGVGLFSVPLAKRGIDVVAVESSPFSFADLETNLPAGHARCLQTTETFLRGRSPNAQSCDLAIVDPPRAGLGAAAIALLAAAAPRTIVYVSCDPSTLARDLRSLLESGYRIGEAHVVDMFPQTFHIESVIRLRRHE